MIMRTTVIPFYIAVVVALLLQLPVLAQPANSPVVKNGQLKVIGFKLCNQSGNPIQLRGMSTHGLNWYPYGDCLNETTMDTLARWGADIIRISMYVQDGGYASDPVKFTNMVNKLVDEASERGMYALIDFHQLTPGDPNANLTLAKKFFTDMANAHKNKNNVLYDICNEPNGVSWATIKNYANQVIPVIRAIDNDGVILVGTHGWSSLGISDGGSAQDILNNPLSHTNIMYTFHFYAASHKDEYLNELSWAADRMPIFVTEFGTQVYDGDQGNDFVMSQRYIDLMRQKKISWCNWNFSDDFRSGAVWKSNTCPNGPWTVSQLKPAGVWIRERIMSPADDFPGGPVTPTCTPVSASGDDGNVAANAVDNNLNTRWSASGDGQWIQFCLNSVSTVNGVDIAFFKGDTRRALFDVQAGNDGNTWTTVASGLQSSGTSLAFEPFSFAPVAAKYIRILGHGNNQNAWNSYTEVKIKTVAPAAMDENMQLSMVKENSGDAGYALKAYPNPFERNLTISFHLKKAGHTKLAVYDMQGKTVSVLQNGELSAGTYTRSFESGNVPSGMYLIRLEHKGQLITSKVYKQ